METPFPPFEPEEASRAGGTRLRDIPLKAIFPNLITLLAICSGLTAIRFAVESRLELAVGAIVLAAFLDGIDGRVARFLKSTTRFGAQMDSLADFVNFGVAPALLLYFTLLDQVHSFGWIAALIFAICACLRLARFNVMLEMPDRPKWQRNFFIGVPAPAGALVSLAPVYAMLLGSTEPGDAFAVFSVFYVIVIALLMVSSLPTFSGKELGRRVPRNLVLPLLIIVVAGVAALLSYPWQMLLVCVLVYLGSLPLGYRSWRAHRAAETAQAGDGQQLSDGKTDGASPEQAS